MLVDTLLTRLEHVRKSGRGHVARCPAHEDRTASLSVAEADDGRVLVHCFAGCRAADVVAAVGLELADLFPERVIDQSPLGRAQRREAVRQTGWAAALGVLDREAAIVQVAAVAIHRGERLAPDDVERLHTAALRICDAREVFLHGR